MTLKERDEYGIYILSNTTYWQSSARGILVKKQQIWYCIKSEECRSNYIVKTVKLAGVLSWALDQAKSWNIRTLGHKPTRSAQPTFYFV